MIRFATNRDRSQLCALWQECFGDSAAYVNLYFDAHPLPIHTMVYEEDGQVVSMLSLLPAYLKTRTDSLPARYIYAVATTQSRRGQGISTRLLQAAHEQMKTQGVALSFLVPSSASLYAFYAKSGFEVAFYRLDTEVMGDSLVPDLSCTIAPASAREWLDIRAHAFSGGMFVAWEQPALAYRLREAAFTGGDVLTVYSASGRAAALCHFDANSSSVSIRELALENMSVQQALNALHGNYGARQYRLRLAADTPCPWESTRTASGAICWYDPHARAKALSAGGGTPYIGLVLD